MNIHRIWMAWGLILPLLTACSTTDELLPNEAAETSHEVKIEVDEQLLTRAGKETFALGDSIGLYVVPRTAKGSTAPAIPQATGNRAHNAKWVKTADGWKPATPYDIILWDASGRPLDFYAYYPYRSDATRPDSMVLSVEADQSLRSRVRHSDVLRAVNTEGKTTGTVQLQFDHVFSITDVRFDKGDVVVNMMQAQVRFSNVVTAVAMNIGTGELTPVQRGMITICPLDWYAMHFEGVLPPQTINKGESTLMLDNASSAYIFQLPSMTLRPGILHPFNLQLKKDE